MGSFPTRRFSDLGRVYRQRFSSLGDYSMAYSDKVLDHYSNPRNVGSLDKNSTEVGTGLVGAPECGDVMKLQIKVNPATNISRASSMRVASGGPAKPPNTTEWMAPSRTVASMANTASGI